MSFLFYNGQRHGRNKRRHAKLKNIFGSKHDKMPHFIRILKPDLVGKDIQVVDDPQDCFLKITLKNLGPGTIHESFYHNPPRPDFQMYNGNDPWGGIVIYGLNPYKNLQKPGGRGLHTCNQLGTVSK